jgi:hypothetical protein
MNADDFTDHTPTIWAFNPEISEIGGPVSWAGIVPQSWREAEVLFWSNVGTHEGAEWFDGFTGVQLNTNQWVHLAFTTDGDTVLMYINGELILDEAATIHDDRVKNFSMVYSGGATDFYLGGNNWDIPFQGRIDELYMFSRVLSAEEIVAVMNHGTDIPSAGVGVTVPELKIGAGKNIIEAEWYDGGEANYSPTTSPWDPEFAARPNERVATEEASNENRTDAPSPNYNTGWTSDGDWYQFTLNFERSGKAKISAWVAGDGGNGIIDVTLAGTTVQILNEGSTGWQDYLLAEADEVIEVTAGANVMKVEFVNGAINIDAFIIDFEADPDAEPSEEESGDAAAPAAQSPALTDENEESGDINIILWIIIGIAVVVIIVIIVILVVKKKK